MNEPRISKVACQDLNEISEYFFERNIDAGEKFFEEFNQKCKNLINFPAMGKSYTLIRPDLRGLPIHSYIILDRITEDLQLEIVRVVNGRQDLR